jgi:hypothetical protein
MAECFRSYPLQTPFLGPFGAAYENKESTRDPMRLNAIQQLRMLIEMIDRERDLNIDRLLVVLDSREASSGARLITLEGTFSLAAPMLGPKESRTADVPSPAGSTVTKNRSLSDPQGRPR